MAFSILFIIFAVGWLVYEYFTDDAYHALNNSIKKAREEYDAERKARDMGKKQLLDEGWVVLESYAYDARKKEIMSKLHEDDSDMLKRTGLQDPPLWSSVPLKYENGLQFRQDKLFYCINFIEHSLINYNEKVISADDFCDGRFPNNERDLRFYYWLKNIYDLYMMDHKSFMDRVGKRLSREELTARSYNIENIVGDLPDPDYSHNPHPIAYLGRPSEFRNASGTWCVKVTSAVFPPYIRHESVSDELYEFLNKNSVQIEDEFETSEPIDDDSDEYPENEDRYEDEEEDDWKCVSFLILRYNNELYRDDEMLEIDEEDIELSLPSFLEFGDFGLLSEGETYHPVSSDWQIVCRVPVSQDFSSIVEDAESHWEFDESTGEFVLFVKAYVVIGEFKDEIGIVTAMNRQYTYVRTPED